MRPGDEAGPAPRHPPALARVAARVRGREETHDCTGWIEVAVAKSAKATFDDSFGHLVEHWLEYPPGDTVSDPAPDG